MRRRSRITACAATFVAFLFLAGTERCLAEPRAADPTFDYGFALRGNLAAGPMGRLAGNGFGADLHVSAFPTKLPLGIRVQAALVTTEERESETSGTFLWWPITMTLTTGHSIGWIGAGPEWRGSTDQLYGECYALLGHARVSPTTSGGSVNLSEEEFPGTSSWMAAIGAALRIPHLKIPRARGDISMELGIEFFSGGECTFYGRPPIVANGDGSYHVQTERARLAAVGLRCGLTWSARPAWRATGLGRPQ